MNRTGRFRALLELARPADWVKNLFVLPALLASGKGAETGAWMGAGVAFAAFSMTAAGVYCINDALDWRLDALHPLKRRRPIPSGRLSIRTGMVAGVVWILAGLATSLLSISLNLCLVVLSYLVLQALYNVVFKKIVAVDVVALALGFVLRAVAGAVAINVLPSLWLLLCVFFLCLFLAGIKRQCDLSSSSASSIGQVASADERHWHSAAGYETGGELHWMLAVTASLAIVTFLMYATSEATAVTTGAGVRGFVFLTPLVVIVMYRFYRASLRGLSDSPLHIALTDRLVGACTISFVAGTVVLLYVPNLSRLIGRMLAGGSL